jgi:hypothetical protein
MMRRGEEREDITTLIAMTNTADHNYGSMDTGVIMKKYFLITFKHS